MSTLVGRVGLYMGGLLIAIAIILVGFMRFMIAPALDRSGAATTIWLLERTVGSGDDPALIRDAPPCDAPTHESRAVYPMFIPVIV